ncbi:hypothetical protein L9W76_03805 [Vibrio aestuarianus]|uniref:hypothetical protein n=1 Tax=Vibrio aestuarianus TaxID=28171 RepID=UPI00237C5A01|nr:hypothetical protein [Vibrio aestuarianus]MDE1252310.1 hypothetical protein [Vibrio aestuarianus]
MRKLVQLKKTKLDKNIQTNRENKIARINKLKNDINKEIRNYDDLGFPTPPTPTPTHMIPRVTIRRPEPAGSNPPTPTHGIPRETSPPPKEYDTAGFPKQRPTTRVASPPPKTNKASGKADSRILELQALKSELATLKYNANGSSHGHKDYEAQAPRLKKQIKELQNELA